VAGVFITRSASWRVSQVEILDATHKPDPKRRRPAAVTAGLGNEVTFHDLRHYYASLLIRHGESVKVVQKRLGHKSAVETLDTYSHLWPDSEDRTREAVDEVLGQAAGGPGAEAAP
jgi:integrase